MVRTRMRTGHPSVYAATSVVAHEGLLKQGSAFTPGVAVWTAEGFASLRKHFVDQPDESDAGYFTKLQRQMEGADDRVIQLMAELHLVHFLLTAKVSGPKKRKELDQILGWMTQPVAVPDNLAAALDHGIVNPGPPYNTARDRQISFLIGFGEAWTDMTSEDRSATLDDPWLFKDFVMKVPLPKSAAAQREGLLHLFHSEAFEAIVSPTHKQMIVRRYGALIDGAVTDVDRQLQSVRAALTPTFGAEFDFYDEKVRPQWAGGQGGAWDEFVKWARRFYESDRFDADERDYKVEVSEILSDARSALAARSDWTSLLQKAFKGKLRSTGDPQNLIRWNVYGAFLEWADSDPDAAEAALSSLWSGGEIGDALDAFFEQLPRSALSGPGTRLSVASFLLMSVDVTSLPPYRRTPFDKARELTQTDSPPHDATPTDFYLSALDFLDRFIDEAATRGLTLRDRLDAQGLVWCLTKWTPPGEWTEEERAAFLRWRGGETSEEEGTLTDLARELYLADGDDFLERLVKLLSDKHQVIFYGPPGTGKTFVAQKAAEYLAGPDGSVEIVQFHPSYSYEDFVQGYRPATGGSGFELRDGPLRRVAQRALESERGTHVLIIDEINRGNLAKVLGELYYLLEYRKKEITLQYADATFRLPENLWIIGTMNTADRSIAIVDGALRRRFYFVPFFPEVAPVRGLLGRWLTRNGKSHLSWLVGAVDRANELLGDRDASIGPSHFMRDDLDEEWIDLIWEHSILPYIAEQLVGEEDRLDEFTLASIRGGSTMDDLADDEADSPTD